MKEYKIKEISECRNCKLLKYCGGGCRVLAKTLDAKDATICKHFEYFDKFIVPVLQKHNIEMVVK